MMEPGLWNASAGKSTPLPAAGDLVYYFPEGHAQHAYITPDFILPSRFHQIPSPMFLCRVAAVQLSAHPISDEVFAKFTLDPISASSASDTPATADPVGAITVATTAAATTAAASTSAQPRPSFQDGLAHHSKFLTTSDAGKGTAFTIPNKCANDILPILDYRFSPPAQALTCFDAHGKAWEFRHIYRGNPLRHLLTTGWSKFVESKMLVQGDTVIFIRGPDGRLFIGIRRDCTNPPDRFLSLHELESAGEEGCFTRRTPCRISQKSVAAAASLAAAGQPFEVIYYPNAGLPEFVVAKELADESKAASFTGFRRENDHLLEKTKKRKAVNPCQAEPSFNPVLKRFKAGERAAGPETPHGEGCSAESSLAQVSSSGFMPQSNIPINSDSNGPASSDIITPAANRFQKTFKLFGCIIQVEEEVKEAEEDEKNQDLKTFNFFP